MVVVKSKPPAGHVGGGAGGELLRASRASIAAIIAAILSNIPRSESPDRLVNWVSWLRTSASKPKLVCMVIPAALGVTLFRIWMDNSIDVLI